MPPGLLQNNKLIKLVSSALMALLFVNFYLRTKEKSIENGFGMVEVMTAARDIPPQIQLRPDYVQTRKIPLRYLEPGAIMVKIPGQGLNRLVDKVSAAPIPAGAQITNYLMKEKNATDSGNVASSLPSGKRSYTLRLGNLDVASLILPGDHIDVLATLPVSQNGQQSKVVRTIVQDVMVVAVGKDLRQSNESVSSKSEKTEGMNITLAVSPDDLQRLTLAQSLSQGEMTVSVRPRGDDKIQQVQVLDAQRLVQ